MLWAIKEALWHSISHVLEINVFTVHSLESRIIVATYAFVVLIVSNTYLANLAAFLTVDKLEGSVQSVSELWGKPVRIAALYSSCGMLVLPAVLCPWCREACSKQRRHVWHCNKGWQACARRCRARALAGIITRYEQECERSCSAGGHLSNVCKPA